MFDPNAPHLTYRGGVATHRMAWGEVGNGRVIAFPTLIRDGAALKQLKPEEAVRYALRTGEYIPFRTGADAQRFTTTYKNAAPLLR